MVDDEGTDTTPTSIGLLADEVGAMRRLEKALNDDLRFEHLTRPVREVRRFIWSCLRDRDTDQAEGFIAQHARDPVEDVCFIPVLSMTVGQEFTVGSIRLLPADAPELPI